MVFLEEVTMPNPNTPTESLKFTEARPKLSELLNRVFRRETRIRLYKGAIPVAAIVSIGDLERLEALDRDRDAALSAMERLGQRFADVSPDDLEDEIKRAIDDVRASRREIVPS
jgi:prevent-host-death family protein